MIDGHFSQAKILIVDDDSSIRWVLSRALQNADFKVIASDNAQAALQLVKNEQPQLVISDIQMSGMDGIELLKTLKQKYPDIPVIMITAYADTEIGSQSHDLGAFDYLPKPFDLNHVVQMCKRAIQGQHNSEQLPAWQLQLHKTIESEYHQGHTAVLQQLQQEFEEFMIHSALKLTQGHKQKAAKLLGWGRNTLTRKLQQLELEPNAEHDQE
ncbi:MAG: response regulator [Kangiellaceae bacterium]|nr:response regulator [Kangiellaceae bacterium]